MPKIFGFDDAYASGLSIPSLSTVHIPTDTVGEAAVRTLVRMISGEKLESHNFSFKPWLVIREP